MELGGIMDFVLCSNGEKRRVRARLDDPGYVSGSVDEIGYPKKASGHYEVSIRHFYTLYSVKKTLLDAI